MNPYLRSLIAYTRFFGPFGPWIWLLDLPWGYWFGFTEIRSE